MAAALPWVLSAVSAVGAVQQGAAQASAAEYNANTARMNADIADSQGEAAAQAQSRDAARRIGAAVADYGASGVAMGEGSPADALAASARSAALDNLTVRYNYKLKALGYQSQAALDEAAAPNYRTASYLAAGSRIGASMVPIFGSTGGK